MRNIAMLPVSLTPGFGSSWYFDKGSIVIRYQPWAAPEARWYAEWVDLLGFKQERHAEDRTRLQSVVPFAFTLRRTR